MAGQGNFTELAALRVVLDTRTPIELAAANTRAWFLRWRLAAAQSRAAAAEARAAAAQARSNRLRATVNVADSNLNAIIRHHQDAVARVVSALAREAVADQANLDANHIIRILRNRVAELEEALDARPLGRLTPDGRQTFY